MFSSAAQPVNWRALGEAAYTAAAAGEPAEPRLESCCWLRAEDESCAAGMWGAWGTGGHASTAEQILTSKLPLQWHDEKSGQGNRILSFIPVIIFSANINKNFQKLVHCHYFPCAWIAAKWTVRTRLALNSSWFLHQMDPKFNVRLIIFIWAAFLRSEKLVLTTVIGL